MESKPAAFPTPLPTSPAEDLVAALEAMRAEAAAAREAAAATHAQLQAMQALTDTALSHLALDDLLRELLGRVTAVMGVDTVVISVLDAHGHTLTLQAALGLGEDDVGPVDIPVGQGIMGRIMASRTPLIVGANALSAADFEGVHPISRESLRSLAGVPLLVGGQGAEGRVVGVLAVGSTVPHRFTEADVGLLQRAADRIALAIDRAHLNAAEHDARRKAEEALARAQASVTQAAERAEQLQTILETVVDGVAVYDSPSHPIQLVNRAYRELYALDSAPTGYEALPLRERVRLLRLRDTIGAPLSFKNSPSGRALRGEVVTGPGADVRARAFDGRELELNVSAAPLRDGDGHVVGAVVVARNVTERKQLEREREAATASELAAREAGRRMEAFLAVAAHDLRSPLTAVVGYLGLAQRRSQRLVSAVRETSPGLTSGVEDVRRPFGGRGPEREAVNPAAHGPLRHGGDPSRPAGAAPGTLRPRRAGARAGRGCARGGSGSGHPNAHPPARRADPGRGRHRPPGAGGHQLPHQRAQILPAGSPSGRFRGGEQGPGAGSGA